MRIFPFAFPFWRKFGEVWFDFFFAFQVSVSVMNNSAMTSNITKTQSVQANGHAKESLQCTMMSIKRKASVRLIIIIHTTHVSNEIDAPYQTFGDHGFHHIQEDQGSEKHEQHFHLQVKSNTSKKIIHIV